MFERLAVLNDRGAWGQVGVLRVATFGVMAGPGLEIPFKTKERVRLQLD